jgi:hypothetical protein
MDKGSAELGTIIIEPRTIQPESLWEVINNIILPAQRLSLEIMSFPRCVVNIAVITIG